MRSLLVTAHPEPQSFNHAMAQTVARALISAGHEVHVLDLHAEGFDPVISQAQFPASVSRARFDVMAEQKGQAERGDAPPDLLRSQQLLCAADILVLQFPLWWWTMPAQLKGWIDRVFSAGFAYDGASLAGRAAMLTVTAETKSERFECDGGNHPLHHIERGILKFCGFEVRPAFVIADIYLLDDEARRRRLADLGDHVRSNFSRLD